jgi:hypothetical protein
VVQEEGRDRVGVEGCGFDELLPSANTFPSPAFHLFLSRVSRRDVNGEYLPTYAVLSRRC